MNLKEAFPTVGMSERIASLDSWLSRVQRNNTKYKYKQVAKSNGINSGATKIHCLTLLRAVEKVGKMEKVIPPPHNENTYYSVEFWNILDITMTDSVNGSWNSKNIQMK